MKKILAFNGSPRPAGNTSHLLKAFLEGAGAAGADRTVVHSHGLDLKDCTGCLRCNILQRCSQSGDSWEGLRHRILEADVLVFATPIYFHHLPASLKRVLDRFRSFAHVRISETGLVHTPYREWKKDFVLILSQGSSDPADSQPLIDLFRYICSIMGSGNRLHVITGTRLAMVNQVIKSEEELGELYRKLGLPEQLSGEDSWKNRDLLERCYRLGEKLSAPD
jgi:multimeric flavodoxin WrbA